jgi:hypothetical protein
VARRELGLEADATKDKAKTSVLFELIAVRFSARNDL